MIKENFNKYFWDVIRHHYLDFSGKATPKQFWMFLVWCFIINFIILFILAFIGIFIYGLLVVLGSLGIITLFNLAIMLPFLAIVARRFKDAGVSIFWFQNLMGLFLLGIITLFISTYTSFSNTRLTSSLMLSMGLQIGSILWTQIIVIIAIVICVLPSKKTELN